MALQILLWLFVGLLVLIVLTMILPIHVILSWQSGPAMHTTVLLRLFGGVSPPIKVYDSTKTTTRSEPEPARKASKPRKQRGKSGKKGWLPPRDILPEGIALLRRVMGAIHIDKLQLDAEVGLGDPGDTGQLYGQLCPLIYPLGRHVTLRPNFEVACLRGSALAHARFTLLGLIWPFVRFGWRIFGPSR